MTDNGRTHPPRIKTTKLHDDNPIIIVGGGCIGLSTAYNLAQSSSSSPKTRIIVIEAFDKPFAAASSTCTGCFHYSFPEPQSTPLLPLGKFSFDLWAAEAEKPDFRTATGYRAQSSFGIDPGVHTTTVNPLGLGKWLTRRCLKMGVELRTGWKAVGVDLSSGNKVQALTCLKEDQTTTRIKCKQLLLACGPWTPTVYQRLFPSSTIRLQWTTNAGDWIICKNPCPTSQDSVAFVSFAGLIGEKFEFAGRNDGTIWACGRRNLTAVLPSPGHSDTPDQQLINELRGRAREWLNWGCNCAEKHTDDFQILSQGRAFRPATRSGLPVMSEVPPSGLSIDVTEDGRATTSSSVVFVCWGHGSWGLTLGMGSGRLMAQLMRGEKPGIDMFPFSLEQTIST
ncbi:hypothetical protein AK830_g4756 [Neonectria ditissima]|uniref:FAD dependent oxidoreductase domain-containing protein n=1 Tax=Neonectria ditissima TaxID=78410 RepID=A0A0P7AV62_9HYPO|nr:hypothetical protein AK830_g4756 [Neonectria ditissima]